LLGFEVRNGVVHAGAAHGRPAAQAAVETTGMPIEQIADRIG
jgi:hypothetical protein